MSDSPAPKALKPGFAVLLFADSFLFGIGLLGFLVWTLVIPEWRANHFFVEHSCEILDKRLLKNEDAEGTSHRAEFLVQYTVDGQNYQLWTYEALKISTSAQVGKEMLEQFVVGQHYPCWYDPDDPGQAVLVRGYSWVLYLFLLIPLGFVCFSAFGMYHYWMHRGKSP